MPENASPVLNLRKLRLYGLAALLTVVLIGATGFVSRERSNARLREWTEAQAIPTVAVDTPSAKLLNPYLDLPGRLEAFSRAPIYARVSGYLKEWKVDIGANVKTGQMLAEIEAPDLDQQLLQARADLLNTQAAARLSEATLKRRQSLANSNIISQQDLDERIADLASKQAAVKSSQANVDRLEALAGYKKVLAPFDGVVTARETDVGSLINAGSSTAPAMFVISDTSKLRVYVNVPQSYVPNVRIGTKAMVTVPEYPDRKFPATVEFSSQAVRLSVRDLAHAAHCRQRIRSAARRRLCQRALQPVARCAAAACAGQRAAVRSERSAGGDRRCRRQGIAEDHYDRPRSRPRYRDRNGAGGR